ncbi:GRIP and coiled-coil domain-containing protein 2 [Carya illinoinensis]|uniref:C2 NT-type domain-containing protein n=1 Tax=Carya illinoinensis TaxID=32201 RepID=A0A8T1QM76_CARIL|nr:GRIP and coiled-coil domain-containing protein 2 [Carya illinoinensis]XP_042979581.1 GRIP and coiled-coil domain-containing protein 2 [Carya illinoinensis]XP_042979582.1 GRIP and coiled-coil domain-containing protein 2 [Carya illinoinensis]XP_042979583.1 GRIP and coiled-coil domain-containing protein 2 [Carya illinoinensis]XP_042979584.1 GRIP and coiled-coil domain-containing protein 2 [Carya illinoinensis]XP_042979585.1 GRIP and coiled-coil domain-containing protein 2 [Carya illinoinensis]
MSRITKWKLEKTKLKVVFRLQFNASHIPPNGWDKLFISFIPADSGKATAKTTKANVRNGTCKWADPIYETTRLLQDIKTRQYDEKFYKLVVAMGSSRSSILGEANINLADYADALKPSAVALPLHGCDSGSILHVTIQLLTSKTGFREFEQQRELRERGLETTSDQNSHYESAGRKVTSSGETVNDLMDKVNARVRFKKESQELPSLEEEVGLNEEYADSAVGFDGSSNTSESVYAEKHDVSSTNEIDSLKSTASGDLGGLSLSQSPQPEKGDHSDNRFLAQGTNDWVQGWSSDYSADNDLAIVYEENSRLRGSLEMAESSILELKLEVSALQSHADEIGVEAQKIAHQLAAEIASGEELAKEVSVMKSECSKFKDDLEQCKSSKLGPQRSESIVTDQEHVFQELHIRWLKGLLLVEDKIRELQNKAFFGSHEGDLRFLHSDLEALLGVLQDVKQGTGQAISGPNLKSVKDTREMKLHRSELVVPGTGFDADLYQSEGILHCLKIPSLVSHESDSVDSMNALKGKLFELLRELDESKAERESLARKTDQMECYYEALVQELEETQRQMMGELQNLRNEHSTCIYTISSTKVEMETMHREMNEQLTRLAKDKCDLESLCKELERRAASAEAALKRARLNYSIAVNQLQKDLELLSFQVLSMFETNENLIKQAFADSPGPVFQGFPEMVKKQKLDSEEFGTSKLLHCQHNYAGVNKENLCGDIPLEDLKRSLCLQEGLCQKIEEEVYETHLVNMYLDIFSKTLQESLREAGCEFILVKEKLEECTRQLELSTKSKELLMLRLQEALDDVHSLNDYKATCIAKCNELAQHSQILESNLQIVTHENSLLNQKITEWEALITEYKSYESTYEACTTEKLELENSLNQKTLENHKLRNDVSSFQEELKAVRTEFDELISEKKNLEDAIKFLQDKLLNRLASCDKKCDRLSLQSESFCQDLESKNLAGVVLQLEELHHNAFEKILQLMEEKEGLVDERDLAQVSLKTAESDNLITKQKFEHYIRAIMDKHDVSSALLQKLQLEVDIIANRVKISSEAEERYSQQHRELLSDLDRFEVELQQLTSQNKDLVEEILKLESVTDNLEKCKVTIATFTEEKDTLVASLEDKTEESAKLALELNNLKEGFQSLHDELEIERSSRCELESTVLKLNLQLDEKQRQLLHYDQQKDELFHLNQMLSDLELEKTRVCHLLLTTEECLESVREECSSLETYLFEMHEFSIDTNVRLIFTRTQYDAWMGDIIQKLKSAEQQLAELHQKHLNEETVRDCRLGSEACYIEEHAIWSTSLDSLRLDLEASNAENRILLHRNGAITSELEKYKKVAENMEATFYMEKIQHALDLERLQHELMNSEEVVDNLMFSKEELDVKYSILKTKLDEQNAYITLLEENKDELIALRKQCGEVNQRLAEQVLKTEEFKNLSIHLKELKDKADADCLQAREKREPEGPPFVMQESLRIAFIKEQYETKLQELKHQISISKKHSDDMLWKLQDAIDEVENRKKAESSHLKRNEELSLRILELEADLHSALTEKRELMKACDLMKAEKECSLISLECCKEEKQELEASLQKCNDEKSKYAAEIRLMRDVLESSTSQINIQKDGYDRLLKENCTHAEPIGGKLHQKNPIPGIPSSVRVSMEATPGNSTTEELFRSISYDEPAIPADETGQASALMNVQHMQDILESGGEEGISSIVLVNREDLLHTDIKHLALANDHTKAQSLKSSLDHLNKELERMKHENSLTPLDNSDVYSNFPGLQRELMLLHKANEELGSMHPSFNEFSFSGNALERVLALEIELAEALQAKKKSSIHFQSSFLRQHGDEEAVFQSFRDINELIKDMLELKGRYSSVETELKDMHDRYSQLSLQFAEVEGERQKLMMTLKNVRASKKALLLNRSSSTSLGENPS